MGIGFNGCSCQGTVLIGGQVGMQFQTGIGLKSRVYVISKWTSIPVKEPGGFGVNRY